MRCSPGSKVTSAPASNSARLAGGLDENPPAYHLHRRMLTALVVVERLSVAKIDDDERHSPGLRTARAVVERCPEPRSGGVMESTHFGWCRIAQSSRTQPRVIPLSEWRVLGRISAR